jgi:hypothetical protein
MRPRAALRHPCRVARDASAFAFIRLNRIMFTTTQDRRGWIGEIVPKCRRHRRTRHIWATARWYIHRWLRRYGAVGLHRACGKSRRQASRGIADIDLPARDVIFATLQRKSPGESGHGVFGYRIRSRPGPRHVGRYRSVIDDPAPTGGLRGHAPEGFAGAKEGTGDVDRHNRGPVAQGDIGNPSRRPGSPQGDRCSPRTRQ